ncbi:hypothetical protein WJX75_009102 [Coccomyxa subellipsoidea]|uniref:RRM domain-containing protein n=1 Tax=Coccomyxa subellipsoidea TaxID=248742 RepID=A0ABR2Z4E3_9CHLO
MSNGGKNTILQMDVVMEERAESKVQTEAEVKGMGSAKLLDRKWSAHLGSMATLSTSTYATVLKAPQRCCATLFLPHDSHPAYIHYPDHDAASKALEALKGKPMALAGVKTMKLCYAPYTSMRSYSPTQDLTIRYALHAAQQRLKAQASNKLAKERAATASLPLDRPPFVAQSANKPPAAQKKSLAASTLDTRGT